MLQHILYTIQSVYSACTFVAWQRRRIISSFYGWQTGDTSSSLNSRLQRCSKPACVPTCVPSPDACWVTARWVQVVLFKLPSLAWHFLLLHCLYNEPHAIFMATSCVSERQSSSFVCQQTCSALEDLCLERPKSRIQRRSLLVMTEHRPDVRILNSEHFIPNFF